MEGPAGPRHMSPCTSQCTDDSIIIRCFSNPSFQLATHPSLSLLIFTRLIDFFFFFFFFWGEILTRSSNAAGYNKIWYESSCCRCPFSRDYSTRKLILDLSHGRSAFAHAQIIPVSFAAEIVLRSWPQKYPRYRSLKFEITLNKTPRFNRFIVNS